MTATTDRSSGDALRAIREGDEAEFGALAERHRAELHVHCYRMLGSPEDAEDAVQETLLRAWRGREGFAGRAPFRAWLYGIATNACLDHVARARRRVPHGSGQAAWADVPWVRPYPDRLLEAAAPAEDQPERVVATRETIGLAFLMAVQHLPPAQRAVLMLRDVLGWSARETAEPLGASVAAVNSSLQRARATLRDRMPPGAAERPAPATPTEEDRDLVRRYVEAVERDDVDGLAAMMTEDARFAMPELYVGREAIVACWVAGGFGSEDLGTWRCIATSVNRQPAVACYFRRRGEDLHRFMALDALRIEDGRVAEITVFSPDVRESLGLPATVG